VDAKTIPDCVQLIILYHLYRKVHLQICRNFDILTHIKDSLKLRTLRARDGCFKADDDDDENT
jgi:hypothetical protein